MSRQGDAMTHHGTISTYCGLRCRCAACTAAWAGYCRAYRTARRSLGRCVQCKAPALPDHARCERCRARQLVHQQAYRQKRKAATV